MSTLRFRAWHPKEKKMHSDVIVGNNLLIYSMNPETDERVWDYADETPAIVMQSTGLKDKNGKEIFEGDVVVCRDMHDSNVFGNAWKTVDGLSVAVPKVIKRDSQGIDWDWPEDIRRHPSWWEVIGNFYENPDLLPSAA